jgi:putative transposase
MRQFNRFKGTKGFITMWERVLRFRYMITEQAKERCRILAFWEKHGTSATTEAFKISNRTLFRWQKNLNITGGQLEGLNSKSTAPNKRRKRNIENEVVDFIIKQRKEHYRIGKKKLTVLIKEDLGISYSESKIGRILFDLKKRNLLPKYVKISMYARTGHIRERIVKKRKKLRIKDYQPEKAGDLVQVDTVVKFINGVRRYIMTAIDIESDFAFAYGYKNLSSAVGRDFLKKLQEVAPFKITHIQTDNGLEFEKYFREYLEEEKIIHFHNYPACPKMNAYVERFNRTIQEQFVNWNLLSLKGDINTFNKNLIDWLLWYNTKRPHESLGMVSPLRYIVSTLPTDECHMWWTRTKR